MTNKNDIYKWFEDNQITTREELRGTTVPFPTGTNQTMLEGFLIEYKKELKGLIQIVDTKKVFVINDLHVPFQNDTMVRNVIKLLEEEQPEEIVLNGDMVDFYDLSSFDKDPAREASLQDELDMLYHILLVFRAVCPDAKITYITGNHEDRLRRFLWKKAPALNSLRSLQFEELLHLAELNIGLTKKYILNGFTFAHGEIVRQYASYSAKAEYDKRGCSGMSGHTHRMGSFCKTTALGTFGWWENGCACGLSPEYTEDPNWQNGFSMVYFDDNAFDVHQVYVHKGKFRFNGKVY